MASTPAQQTITGAQTPDIRILMLDVLRGFAVLGIYLINITVFFLDSDSYMSTVSGSGMLQTDPLSGPVSDVLVEGTMVALFSMLFGASAMVFLGEARLVAQGLDVVDRYYRRTLLLVLFGLLHAYVLLWENDVLYIYGILGMFLFPLRKLRVPALLVIGLLFLWIGDMETASLYSGFEDADSSGPPALLGPSIPAAANTTAGTGSTGETADSSTQAAPEIVHRNYKQRFKQNLGSVLYEQSTKLYTDHIFNVGGMMIIGMALFRLGILAGTRSRRFYLLLMAGGYLAGTLGRDTQFFQQLVAAGPVLDDVDSSVLGYNYGRLLVALGHMGLLGVLVSFTKASRVMRILARALAAVGRLALTNYIMQTVISLLVFYIFDAQLLTGLDRANLIYICITVWVFQIAFSNLWMRYFKLGPLEWLWRSLIYGKLLPIVASGATSPATPDRLRDPEKVVEVVLSATERK